MTRAGPGAALPNFGGHGIVAPVRRDRLVPREDLLEELLGHLEAGERLITVTGPPGVGKTTLARQLMSRLLLEGHGYPGGLQFLDLDGYRDLSIVSAHGGWGLLAPRSLPHRPPTLLVLDNFEHMPSGGAATVAAWLDAAPDLTVLVTSRRCLSLPGERRVSVEPLALPTDEAPDSPAMALWTSEMSRHLPGYAPSPEARTETVRLLRRLGGLPLAIRLAAGLAAAGERAKSSLNDWPLELAQSTYATLDETIGLSWSRSSEVERAALAGLSVFRGSCDEVSAADVLRSSSDTLASLVDRSLVVREEGPKGPALRLLEPIRAYAAGQLASDALEAAEEAHAAWTLERYGVSALARLPQLLDAQAGATDLDAVVERALARGGNRRWAEWGLVAATTLGWFAYGTLASERRLERLLTLAEGQAVPTLVREHARLLLGRDCAARGDHAAAAEIWTRLDRQAGDGEIGALVTIYQVASRTDRPGGAPADDEADLQDVIDWASRQGRFQIVARARRVLGSAAAERGDMDTAEPLLLAARRAYLEAESQTSTGEMSVVLGSFLLEIANRGDDARRWLTDGITRLEEAKSHYHLARAHGRLALLDFEQRDLEAAEAHAVDAIRVAERLGHERRLGMAFGTAGLVALQRLGLDAARQRLGNAVDYLAAVDVAHQAYFRAALMLTELLRGDATKVSEPLLRQASAPRSIRSTADYLPLATDLLLGAASPSLEVSTSETHGGRLQAARVNAARYIDCSIMIRLSAQLVEKYLDSPVVEPAPARLVCQVGFERICTPDGELVDCRRRSVIRRLIACLAQQHLEAPGHPISHRQLLAAGWPGEKILAAAATNRLHVSLTRIRKLGLRDALESVEGGWRFSPNLTLQVVDVL